MKIEKLVEAIRLDKKCTPSTKFTLSAAEWAQDWMTPFYPRILLASSGKFNRANSP
jgi:hypothetical protein